MNQKISGLYKGVVFDPSEGRRKRTELELRVDVDGVYPLNVISGDFYTVFKSTRKYLRSFIFYEVEKIETSKRILLIGKKGEFSLNSDQFDNIEISISANSHTPKATFRGTNCSRTKFYCSCKHVSNYFRTVYLEHDYEEGVMPLEPYETTNLPSRSLYRPPRISIIDAFAEAGIEIVISNKNRDSVPSPSRTREYGGVWTDADLYKAMEKYFTLFKEEPQWTLWLLSANEYVMSNTYGIVIGGSKKRRRGCAIFQNSTGWQSLKEKRFRLFIYVHELGHCFNLNHSWDVPQDDSSREAGRYATLSWMNLPWRYYSSEESHGAEAFWKAFNFEFSDSELMHLRHAFRDDIIFDGNNFDSKINAESRRESRSKGH